MPMVLRLGLAALAASLSGRARAQQALTWRGVRDKFEAANAPTQAGLPVVSESRAEEIAADLRPDFARNPPIPVYQSGAVSLLDFLNAQTDYRSVRLNYLNLAGTCPAAAAQWNLAVGHEVIQ